jgi:hypothetical protein
MQAYRAGGYGHISLVLFLTRYLDLQPPGELCVTTYCGNLPIATIAVFQRPRRTNCTLVMLICQACTQSSITM